MNRKQVALLFLASMIPTTFHILRPDLVGADSYYFLNHICGNTGIPFTTEPLAAILFQFIPCDLILVKILLGFLLFLNTLFVSMTGELFNKKDGWLAGWFCFISIIWIKIPFEFENDVFAFPLLFLSIYFLFKGVLHSNRENTLFGLGVLMISGLLWRGAVYYIPIFALYSGISLVILFAVIIMYGPAMLTHLLPAPENALESTPFFGAIQNTLLFPAVLYYYPALIIPMFYFLILAAFEWKLSLHMIPFFAISLTKFYSKFPELKNEWLKAFAYWLKFGPALILLIFSAGILIQFPHQSTFNAIDYAVEMSDGNVMWNDWDLGYWIEYRGGKPMFWGGMHPPKEIESGVVITSFGSDCQLLREFSTDKVLETEIWSFRDLNVYMC